MLPYALPPPEQPVPAARALYETGAGGKHLLGGRWWFRADTRDVGLRAGFARAASAAGWSPVSVPHVWNASDLSRASMLGSVGWYRRDFRLPRGAKGQRWAIRFESANQRVRVWLNGRQIGTHEGAYLPFELPARGVRARGINRLVVRVDSRSGPLDLPAGGLDAAGEPDGGWWNYGGLNREVYLRRVGRAELTDVHVNSGLRCGRCAADVRVVATVRNTTDGPLAPRISTSFGGQPIDLSGPHRLTARPRGGWAGRTLRLDGPGILQAGETGTFEASFRVPKPRLWSPRSPWLYPVRVRTEDSTWLVRHGIRTLRVRDGILLLNGAPVRLRGASIHEDDPRTGSALTAARRRADMAKLRRLGATITRSHYPLHPDTLELADRAGILVWAGAPIYQLRAAQVASPLLRSRARRYLREQVLRDRDHPSVLAWSLLNELPARPSSAHAALIRSLAKTVREVDGSRLVAADLQGYPTVGPQEAYRGLDALGLNDYFGWYPGPNGSTAAREGVGPYLDAMRAAYPRQALFVTEFGAEANRSGPVDEKGTYAFQRDLLAYHLSVFDRRPFVNGAIVWILRDFRVKPGWQGGNPKPAPPVTFKGLLTQDGVEKPAFAEIARLFRAH